MLTRDDRTVGDCLAVLDEIAPLGLRHVGFKDVGVDRETLRVLARRIRELGATSYLEVVSLAPDAAVDSARAAVELEVDQLLGGTQVEATLQVLAGTGIGYLPFPGSPDGHPTRLGGSPAEVAADCARFLERGCAGADLLAFRAFQAEPLALVQAARAALGAARLVVAGSIDTPQKVAALAERGVDAFTVGSAVFERAWAPSEPTLLAQLRAVLAACEACPTPARTE